MNKVAELSTKSFILLPRHSQKKQRESCYHDFFRCAGLPMAIKTPPAIRRAFAPSPLPMGSGLSALSLTRAWHSPQIPVHKSPHWDEGMFTKSLSKPFINSSRISNQLNFTAISTGTLLAEINNYPNEDSVTMIHLSYYCTKNSS